MTRLTKVIGFAGMIGAVTAAPGAAIDVRLVPVGGNGSEITVTPGDRVALEVWVSDWTGYLLRGIEVAVDPASLSNESGNTLTLFEPDLNGDGSCDPGNEAYCSFCDLRTSSNYSPSGMFADGCRDDHLFQLAPDATHFWLTNPAGLRFIWNIFRAGDSVEDPGIGPYYMATIVFDTPDTASGLFQIEFDSATVALDADALRVKPLNLTGAQVWVQESAYGDVNRDDKVDLADITCVLDGFVGVHAQCPFDAVDIEPCDRNRKIDIFDIFGVLDAFIGAETCNGRR